MRLALWTFARKRTVTPFKARKGRPSSISCRPATMWLVVPILTGRRQAAKMPTSPQRPGRFPASMKAKAQGSEGGQAGGKRQPQGRRKRQGFRFALAAVEFIQQVLVRI